MDIYDVTVELCLEAVKQVLPRDTAMLFLTKWYCTHNAPGSLNGQSEWFQFAKCLMGLIGYDVTKLQFTQPKRTQVCKIIHRHSRTICGETLKKKKHIKVMHSIWFLTDGS